MKRAARRVTGATRRVTGATRRVTGAVGVAAAVVALAGAAWADPSHAAPAEGAGYDFAEHVPGAARLEGRIRAPCCLKTTGQTLDIHGSPVALELRREIRERLKQGEAPDHIEADLVKRYGPEILAVPPGNPLGAVGTGLAVLFGVAGIGAFALLVRWRRRTPEAPARSPEPADSSGDAALDARIDAELRDL